MFGVSLLGRKKQEPAIEQTTVQEIRPREDGGIRYYETDRPKVDTSALRQRRRDKGYYCYLTYKTKGEAKPFYPTPEVQGELNPRTLAEVFECPWLKLKRLKTGILQAIAGWIPIAFIALGILFLILMM